MIETSRRTGQDWHQARTGLALLAGEVALGGKAFSGAFLRLPLARFGAAFGLCFEALDGAATSTLSNSSIGDRCAQMRSPVTPANVCGSLESNLLSHIMEMNQKS